MTTPQPTVLPVTQEWLDEWNARPAGADVSDLIEFVPVARQVLGTTDQQPETALVDRAEAHRLALSEALGLGTGAPWDAIRDRAAELHRAPVDRGAVLREAADAVLDIIGTNARLPQTISGVYRAADHLRRLADEAQQPTTTESTPFGDRHGPTPDEVRAGLAGLFTVIGPPVACPHCPPDAAPVPATHWTKHLIRHHPEQPAADQPDTETEAARCAYCKGDGTDPDDPGDYDTAVHMHNPHTVGPCPKCNGTGRATP